MEVLDPYFDGFKLLKKEPDLSSARDERVNVLVNIGCILMGVFSVLWCVIWFYLDHNNMVILSAVFSLVAIILFRMNKVLGPKITVHWTLVSITVWAIVIIISASGPGGDFGGSVHAWFLVLAVIAYFIFSKEKNLWKFGYTLTLISLFLIVEFSPPSFEPIIMLSKDNQYKAGLMTWLSCFLTVVFIFILLLRDINIVEGRLNNANCRLEELLENMLPVSIAKRLAEEGTTFADGFSDCTILFADIVGFTKMSKDMPPRDVVNMLNKVFGEFDDATMSLGLEKIKTIGDAYMAAAGVPESRKDHAEAIAHLAQKFKKIISKYPNISIRIGINSGQVTAGVIGKKRFIYDLWGDAVNVASRMESHGIENSIQISESTYELIKHKFDCQYRGEIELKGRGKAKAYLLT